eukprot:NODE_6_length_70510_cov_1.054395.p3 type:complete len:982 gc:universal NODE_6_length_70510_cov_1.054395:55118-52173(-)
MSSSNLNLAGKKSKQYKKYASQVDDRKSKLAKEFHHEIFPLKADIFEGELALVIKDYAADVLTALIHDNSTEKWAVLQFCILLWSDSMGKTDSKLEDLIKFSIAAKPEDGMPILALTMFSSGTFKTFELNIDQQVAFTSAALSLIVAASPYLYHEIQTIRRNELWAHGGSVFTLALGDRFLPSHFCWTRLRNLVQVLLDSVVKNYLPDLVHHFGYSYSGTKSSSPDPRILESIATPYMNLIVQQPLPAWVSLLKFKLHSDIPHESKFGEPYKLIWNSAVGMVCQVALKHAAESDLKLTVVEPKWGWNVLQRWLQDSSFRLFWHEQEEKDVSTLCQILNNVRSDTLQQAGVSRVLYFLRGIVQRCFSTPNTDWDMICGSCIHVFQSIYSSVHENSTSTMEKIALSESFATVFLVVPLTSNPQSHLNQIENIQGAYFVDYIIERWSDITYSAFLKHMNANEIFNLKALETFSLTNHKLFTESEYFTVEAAQKIGDSQWSSNWYYPYNLLEKTKLTRETTYLMMDFFAKSQNLKLSVTAKRIIAKTQVKMLFRVVLAAWTNRNASLFDHAEFLVDKYIFGNMDYLELLFSAPDTAAPVLFIFDILYQLKPKYLVEKLQSISSDNFYFKLMAALFASNKKEKAVSVLEDLKSKSQLDLSYFWRLGQDLFLYADSTDLNHEFIINYLLKYVLLYEQRDKEISKDENVPLICNSMKLLGLYAVAKFNVKDVQGTHLKHLEDIVSHCLILSRSDNIEIMNSSIDLLYTLTYGCFDVINSISNGDLLLNILCKMVTALEEQKRIIIADHDRELIRARLIEKQAFFLVDSCCLYKSKSNVVQIILPVLNAISSLEDFSKIEPNPFKNAHIANELKTLSAICQSSLIHLYNKTDLYDSNFKEIPQKCISLPKSILLLNNNTTNVIGIKTLFNSSKIQIDDVTERSKKLSFQPLPMTNAPTSPRVNLKEVQYFKRSDTELVKTSLEKYFLFI